MNFSFKIVVLFFMLLLPFCTYAEVAATIKTEDVVTSNEREIKKISFVTFGDDFMSGYGVSKNRDFSTTLERKLLSQNKNIRIYNHSKDGETTESALMRIEEIIELKPYMVILELGINDLRHEVPLQNIYSNLAKIITILHENKIRVLLVGFNTPDGAGEEYKDKFTGMYKYLSKQFKVPLHEDFLKDFTDDSLFLQPDGIHPNQNGVAKLVENISPTIDKIVARIK